MVQDARAFGFKGGGDNCNMITPSKFRPQAKLPGLLAVGALCLLGAAPARAQNIDEGKSAQQLYAATCAACHKSPGALAKGRFRATLFPFLKDHYTTGTAEAWALASYLASVDAGPPRSKKTGTTKKRPSSAASDQPN
jgi:mono/diheme cytochrome c family protein